MINSYNGKAIDKAQSIEIESKISIYDKITEILEVIDDVKFYDNIKDIFIETKKVFMKEKLILFIQKAKHL